MASSDPTGALKEQVRGLRAELGRPIVVGVLGAQGTGKSTLCGGLCEGLAQQGLRAATLSIDDLYLSAAERRALRSADPRYRFRGPPGTHDLERGLAALDAHRAGSPLALPRFDKAAAGGEGERISDENVGCLDVLFFEGWFVGADPVEPAALGPREMLDDVPFAAACNEGLRAYLPLWERIDLQWVLWPEDWRWSLRWRADAERELRAQGRGGMSDAEVADFVRYFFTALHPELFIAPLRANADAVLTLDFEHRVVASRVAPVGSNGPPRE